MYKVIVYAQQCSVINQRLNEYIKGQWKLKLGSEWQKMKCYINLKVGTSDTVNKMYAQILQTYRGKGDNIYRVFGELLTKIKEVNSLIKK